MEELKSMFTLAATIGNQTKIKMAKTKTGIKDTYLDHFIELMFSSHKKQRGAARKQATLDEYINLLPDNVMSPVWCIKGKTLGLSSQTTLTIAHLRGLDPHLDTPVEVLHTILLGFVKYFWRDVVQNRLKSTQKKELLETRLSSLDVSGLGFSKLSGRTLVQYSGSLTGRDFRVIAQVAPFVLYDLVPAECYQTWVSLSNLMPLIWQPRIPNIDEHIVSSTE